jgi:hypothetical protein
MLEFRATHSVHASIDPRHFGNGPCTQQYATNKDAAKQRSNKHHFDVNKESSQGSSAVGATLRVRLHERFGKYINCLEYRLVDAGLEVILCLFKPGAAPDIASFTS